MAKVPKHDYEKTYEESDKRIKRSSCSLSSDDDDAKHEVIITGSTHKCNICEKEFSSGQALGGHKRSHPLKKIELETPSSPEISPEKRMKKSSFSLSSDEDDVKHEVSKHQCNICGKTFKNGKALGGHRRSHFIKKKLNHPENHVIRKSSSSSNYKSPTEHHKEDQAYGNFSLPKWQKKDRRGRKCIGSVEAAENLLLLRSDKYFCVGESSSNWNGKNELGGDRNSSDEQHKKGIFLFDLNESYAIQD